MKVLITTEWYSPVINGVVTSVTNLQRELTRLGHDVKVLTLSDTRHSYEEDGVIYIGSLGTGKIYPGSRVALHSDNRYIKKILKWKPDIIHSQSEFSAFIMARHIGKKLDIPIVHTYHTVYENYTHYFSPVEKWGKVMAGVLTNKVLKFTDCVIAPTEKVRSLLLGYGVEQKIYVVPTGLDLTRYNVLINKSMKDTLLKKIGIPNDNRVLVFIGRLAKEKNLEEIMSYLSRLNRKDYTLLIVGDGPHRKDLEQYSKELGLEEQVIFTGMVSPQEIGSYYQLGDVFVTASNSETQGLTYIEALVNGVPALCRKDPCLEGVIEDGVNGWQYSSFEQFQERLDSILSTEDNLLGKNARNLAMRDFSSVSFAKKVEKVYMETMELYEDEHKNNELAVGYAE